VARQSRRTGSGLASVCGARVRTASPGIAGPGVLATVATRGCDAAGSIGSFHETFCIPPIAYKTASGGRRMFGKWLKCAHYAH
jgi:hypothetical protein